MSTRPTGIRFFHKIRFINGGKDMANEGKKSPKKLSPQSEAFLEILTERGLVEDKQINDEKRRKAEKEKKRKMFHNTELLLKNYREITWMLECLPVNISEELDKPIEARSITQVCRLLYLSMTTQISIQQAHVLSLQFLQ